MQEFLGSFEQFLTQQVLRDPHHLLAREFWNNLELEVEFSRKITIFASETIELADDFFLIHRVDNEEVKNFIFWYYHIILQCHLNST